MIALLLPFGEQAAACCSDRLLAEFGSLAGVLAAPLRRCEAVLGGRPGVAVHLASIRQAMLYALREEALLGPQIAGTEALAAYLRADMGHRPCEQFRLLFLTTGNRLVADEVMFQGSIDSAAILPRPIIHRALELGATGLIMIHNHPSGDPEPSMADLAATNRLMAVCRPLEIMIHDHLIVAKSGWTSLRLRGLI